MLFEQLKWYHTIIFETTNPPTDTVEALAKNGFPTGTGIRRENHDEFADLLFCCSRELMLMGTQNDRVVFP